MRLFLKTFLAAAVAAVLLNSCDTGNSSGNSGNINIPDASKPFVGYWERSTSSNWWWYYYIFRPDGTCTYYAYNGYNESSDTPVDGVWNYDPETKILATTMEGHQWQVTISADNEWSGIALWLESESHTFTRLSDADMIKYIVPGQWVSDDKDTITFKTYDEIRDSGHTGNVYSSSESQYGTITYNYWRYGENDNDCDGKCYVYDKVLKLDDGQVDEDDVRDTALITIINPYIDERCSLVYESTLDGHSVTYKKLSSGLDYIEPW